MTRLKLWRMKVTISYDEKKKKRPETVSITGQFAL